MKRQVLAFDLGQHAGSQQVSDYRANGWAAGRLAETLSGLRQDGKKKRKLRDYVGDRLSKGGNDYPVKAMGVDCLEVSGWRDTALIIQTVLDVV